MSIEGCVRRRSRRKSGHTRSTGFTIAAQSDVAFGNCYGGTVSIEGCVRRRSRRKSRHTRSTGFTIAAQSDVAFGNCYGASVSIVCVAAAEGCVRRRSRRKSGHPPVHRIHDRYAIGRRLRQLLQGDGEHRRLRPATKSSQIRTHPVHRIHDRYAIGRRLRQLLRGVGGIEGCVRRRNRRKSGHTRSTGFTFAAQSIATSRCSSATTGFVGAGFCLVRFDDDQQRARPDYSSYSARAFAQRETDGEQTDGSDTREKSDRA